MRLIIFLTLLIFSDLSFAEWSGFFGIRSGSTDSSSFSSGSALTGVTGQTSGALGAYYNQSWGSVFGTRTGLMVSQFSFGEYVGSIINSGYETENVIAVPMYLKADLGPYFTLLVGAYYWTVNSETCINNGIFAGSKCTMGNGAGIAPHVGFGINFGKTFEMDLAYEPSVVLNTATPNFTVTTVTLDFVFKL